MTSQQADTIISLLYFLNFMVFSSIVFFLVWSIFSKYLRW